MKISELIKYSQTYIDDDIDYRVRCVTDNGTCGLAEEGIISKALIDLVIFEGEPYLVIGRV